MCEISCAAIRSSGRMEHFHTSNDSITAWGKDYVVRIYVAQRIPPLPPVVLLEDEFALQTA